MRNSYGMGQFPSPHPFARKPAFVLSMSNALRRNTEIAVTRVRHLWSWTNILCRIIDTRRTLVISSKVPTPPHTETQVCWLLRRKPTVIPVNKTHKSSVGDSGPTSQVSNGVESNICQFSSRLLTDPTKIRHAAISSPVSSDLLRRCDALGICEHHHHRTQVIHAAAFRLFPEIMQSAVADCSGTGNNTPRQQHRIPTFQPGVIPADSTAFSLNRFMIVKVSLCICPRGVRIWSVCPLIARIGPYTRPIHRSSLGR